MSWMTRLHFGIRGRLFGLVVLFAVGCAALAAALISIQAERSYESRMQGLRQLVATAHGVLAAHKAIADAGQMPVEEAKKRALKVIGTMWWGKADYFTARNLDGISLLNPAAPEKEGQNRDASTDSKGKHYSREMTQIIGGPGEGFVTYYTLNPDTKIDAEKTTFIKLFKPWGIGIAAGVFTDDLAAETHASAMQAALITLLLVLALGGVALWQARAIANALGRLRGVMLELANGRDSGQALDTGRGDEIGDMARAVQVFRDNAERAREIEALAERSRNEAESERTRNERERGAAANETQTVVNLVADALSKLSDGDLTVRIDQMPETYRMLQVDFNSAVSKLEDTMRVIAASGFAIGTGASEITQASYDLSTRTASQAASLEQTAAALEEITVTVQRTAEGADHARSVVAAAKVDAEASSSVVSNAVAAMGDIAKSSSEITQIIGVIDEIAFQTNLLALNAGVEAARAGDAGRGFAVVASEVRALAQRSADAAKQIKALISASSGQVAYGVSLVGQTGDVLKAIVEQVSNVTQIVTEIAASAKEQATGLGQVNTAVNQMDQITQQNSAMVEESTAACKSLASEAEELQTLLARFKVANDGSQTHRKQPAPSRAIVAPAAAPAPASGARKLMGKLATALKPTRQTQPADDWEEF